MCSIDWRLVIDLIAAGAALGTLIVAGMALNTWRAQARASVAEEVETAARALRYAFYDARSPMIFAWEWPDRYWETGQERRRTDAEEGDAHWHVYRNRLKDMWPSVRAIAALRAKCGAAFGDATADACENLALAAQKLSFYMEEDAKIRHDGDAVRQWSDQEHVKDVSENTLVSRGSKDKLSMQFETALDALRGLLTPHR